MSLPTLPKNEGLEKALGCSVVHYHEAIAYGQACRAAALEEAAMAIVEPIGHDDYTAMRQAAKKLGV